MNRTIETLAFAVAVLGVVASLFCKGNLFSPALDIAVLAIAVVGSWMMWQSSGARDQHPVVSTVGVILSLPAGLWFSWVVFVRHGVFGMLSGVLVCVLLAACLCWRKSKRSES